MNKKTTIALMVLIALLWVYPFYDSIQNDARSMDDLSRASRIMVIAGMTMLFILMIPFFKWIWNWIKKWVNGEIL